MATVTAGRYGIANYGDGRIVEVTESASQSFKALELVTAASGTATAVVSDGGDVLGLALKAATNVTTGMITIPVFIPGPHSTIWLQAMNNTTAAAGASTHLFNNYYLTVASNIPYCDYSDATVATAVATVVGKHPSDAWTDTNCRYECKITPIGSQDLSGTVGEVA